ncbi:hypothetical protein [Variovorax sp. WDL1]|uniref:hypothetical protein n=1 Tax=Variovorax sp. WDL1 TaxID=207745 RepID=UPI0008383E64|nr:hypothetical protein [Variovorax sp. WDL1]
MERGHAGGQELHQQWAEPVHRGGRRSDGFIFFAEDIFGVQFAIKDDVVVSFDPESGEAEEIAGSIEEWANKLLLKYP